MTVFTNSAKAQEFHRFPCREFYPLDQARYLKADIERNLELENFDKAIAIAQRGIKLVDSSMKLSKTALEKEILDTFNSEFVRYKRIIIPSREADLKRQRQQEKDELQKELEREKFLSGRMLAHGSAFDSFYCVVDPEDYSSMYPTASEYLANTSIRYPSIHNSTTSTDESSDLNCKTTQMLSPPAVFAVPPYTDHSSSSVTTLTVVNQNHLAVPGPAPTSNTSCHKSHHNEVSGLFKFNDPLHFSTITDSSSAHCSFYDNFASFSISNNPNSNSSIFGGGCSNQFTNAAALSPHSGLLGNSGNQAGGFSNLPYSSIHASRFPLVLESGEPNMSNDEMIK